MDWLLSGLTIVLNLLLGIKNKWGWILMILFNFLWIYYALSVLNPPQYGLLPAIFINIGIAAFNAKKWFEEDNNNKDKKETKIELPKWYGGGLDN